MSRLSEIEGLDGLMEQKLISAGITTVEAFVAATATSKERAELSKKIDVAEKIILKWANRVDLARVKGIGTGFADLLEAAGVDTVPELAQRNAENLLVKLTEVNKEYNFTKKLPTEKQLEDWITQAKNLPRAIHY